MSKNTFETPSLTVADLSRSLYDTSLRLQEANDQLKMQEKERMEFYANISHDLRAPITAIANSIEYLQSAQNLSTEELQSTLGIMEKRTSYLKDLINDIFLLSSLESSDDKFHPEEVDLCFLLEDFFYMCQADQAFQDCDLTLDIPIEVEEAHPVVMADPHLLQRVLNNLVGNAFCYSDGRPEIKLGLMQTKQDFISFYVEDHGIGISEENIAHIFERSFRVDKNRTPGFASNNGFGLAIVKLIAERHGGSISCQSQIGEGSKFIFSLPTKCAIKPANLEI